MSKIENIEALEILDSRGNPTILTKITLDCGIEAKSSVPSGASKGENEAIELRDEDRKRYSGKGVQKACAIVKSRLLPLLKGMCVFDQVAIDKKMIELDGTENKSKLGANSILSVSTACAKAASLCSKIPLYKYLGGAFAHILPCPMMNIINGGVHADNSLDFQEFMIRPKGAPSFAEGIRWGAEVYHVLKSILKESGHITSVGDEGGFAPNLRSHEEALDLICKAIEKAGFNTKNQISLAMDCAATELYDPKSGYTELKKKALKQDFKTRTSEDQVLYLESLINNYPIDTIEDGMAENDWKGWALLTKALGSKVQLIGDDIFVTNPKFLQRGIQEQCANSILIKINQIGTLTETFETMQLANRHGYSCIISHRSGETEDSIIADIAVATGCGQIKTGAPCRSDRVAKYNRLLEIEHDLKSDAKYVDGNRFANK